MKQSTKKVTSKDSRSISTEIEHPQHYNSHPSGVECLTVAQEFNFNLGNVIKYVWRAGLKHSALDDLRKAQQYIAFEIKRREEEACR